MLKKIVQKQIDDLKFAEYNPRQLSDDQYKHLKESIDRFGLVDPIIINKNKDRKNTIIGGHQRVKVARTMGIKEVPCVEIDLDYDKERELNVRLNKNTGDWDFDILNETFEIEQLLDWGFDNSEINFGIEDVIKDEEEDFRTLSLKLPEPVYSLWKQWKSKAKELTDSDSEINAFEYAIVEALNTPIKDWYGKTKEI